MLETLPGGKFHFQIAIIYRHSYLISSILSSSEVWYGISIKEYEQLEQVDEMWMQNLMKCSSSVPKGLLYLELAVLPIRFIIQTRRLLYFHHLLQQKKDSLLHRFFMALLNNPTAKDWVSQVLDELEDLSIHYQIEEIEAMKKTFLKNIVKDAIKKKAFEYLMEKKGKKNFR